MQEQISVTIKIFPPFSKSSKSIERTLYINKDSTIANLLNIASKEGLIDISEILENNEIKDGVVILVNGRNVYNLAQKLDNNDKVVILPLAPGG
ncbi:MAG: MoaD/ThiS family protein [Desulfurococcaceae archaeon]|jgi:molybdopterin converting factor small subunit|nr:MoaD/ThiS family protein [Desulfurococcaceae archaeon]MCC6058377.1 MoaD/ThiS family protein [Desulfurococcaceae archaeon]